MHFALLRVEPAAFIHLRVMGIIHCHDLFYPIAEIQFMVSLVHDKFRVKIQIKLGVARLIQLLQGWVTCVQHQGKRLPIGRDRETISLNHISGISPCSDHNIDFAASGGDDALRQRVRHLCGVLYKLQGTFLKGQAHIIG